MSDSHPHVEHARRYLRAIEEGASFETLSGFFTEDAVQIEYPNRFVPAGATRSLAEVRAARERGSKAVRSERYAIRNVMTSERDVALEITWTAELLVPVGKLAAGDTMTAHFGVFLTFRDGRICSQRNYDCFEPF